MPTDEFFAGCRRAVAALADAVEVLESGVPDRRLLEAAVERGHCRPEEEAELLSWFARFLTVRSDLWEVLGDVSRPVGGSVRRVVDDDGLRCFVLGYTAACLTVRLDRLLLERLATDTVIQRKLNEGSVEHRIPRKQYTAVFESFTNPGKARLMDQAMRFVGNNRELVESMAGDRFVGSFVAELAEREKVLDPSRRRYISLLAEYLAHAFRRRGASARQQTLFAVLEAGGRMASELRDRWTPDRIDGTMGRLIETRLRPGDVIITRHDHALTNLFLPGYWPHAALFIGSESDRAEMNVNVDDDRASRWRGDRQVLEALKDGVLFRSLDTTLAVDAVAVIRPQLETTEIATGLGRAVEHEGKLYNFDFDFFRSDRLVCTEVVYRAFDGLGGIRIPLRQRSGRPTLSAEDLLDLAHEGSGFDPVLVFGCRTCPEALLEGEKARAAISPEQRSSSPQSPH
jgi:hypothetical protein